MATKVVCVSPFNIRSQLPYDLPEFPAPKNGAAYTLTEIRGAKCERDMGTLSNPKREALYVDVLAIEAAVDAVRVVNGWDKGLFVISSDQPTVKIAELASGQGLPIYFGVSEPTVEMVATATRRMRMYMEKKIAEADKIWARTQNPREIDDPARACASYLKMERPWNYDVADQVNCENCGKMISPAAAKCPYCPNIRNWDKAKAMGLVTREQYEFATGKSADAPAEVPVAATPVKRGPGRPRKVRAEEPAEV